MGLGEWLKRKKTQPVWAIKQIDDDLLHLCGKGSVSSKTDATELLRTLRQGEFSGAVCMQENGAVLNATQFAALVPESDFSLIDDGQAQWRNLRWRLSWVPQRCWLHNGRLTIQHMDLPGRPHLVSLEDTTYIRAKAEPPSSRTEYVSLEPKDTSSYWLLRDKDDYRA